VITADRETQNTLFGHIREIMNTPTRIYCFCNEGRENWFEGVAIREDGKALARHISGTAEWIPFNLGIGSFINHETYKANCPKGFELVWVHDPANHEALGRVYKLNQERKAAAA